jgi:biopolymer transport protein ExbD
MARVTHAQEARKATRLVPEDDPEFQIAPMIDILLVLLVFFMSISTSEILQVNNNVVLPVAKDAARRDKNKRGEVIVNVLWNPINSIGTLEVGDTDYTEADQIAGILADAVQANPETRILIRADRNVRYEYLRSVMAVAAKAGVSKVTFSVVDKDGGSGAPEAAAPTP